jgi:uncharacterized protein (TIGR00730 family)
MKQPIVTVFGSSRSGPEEEAYQEAVLLGERLAAAGIGIATGGYGGIMEAALRGAAPFDVPRIGIIADELAQRRVNPFVGELVRTRSYLERLQRLLHLGDGYALFPGGTGTLLELLSIWALSERGLLPPKPTVCIGVRWRELLSCLRSGLEGSPPHVTIVATAQEAAEYLIAQLQGQPKEPPIRQHRAQGG